MSRDTLNCTATNLTEGGGEPQELAIKCFLPLSTSSTIFSRKENARKRKNRMIGECHEA